ncbi:hypothetical protein E3N88_30277 [Mikania micrantha]|uniref:WAT1-related protein n=1 Tax=Mikania micrantha TaxID=192012 RepID=A0A5N6MP34_9ASTR|nr:hypothetical protein E3N88_30277 [Mikania micrantha]
MSKSWSWMDDVLPFVAMLMINCSDMAVLTIIKAAMNDGMHSIVYVTYHNALGTLLLLPFFIVHTLRKVDRPPLTFRIIFRFFILGLFGCFLQLSNHVERHLKLGTWGYILDCGNFQAKTAREYPNQNTILFFYSLFGTLQCIALSPFLERNRSAWVLQHGTFVSAVVLGAVYSTVIHNLVVTWCLRKNGPVFVAMFSPLSIVIAMIMGVAFLGDSLRLGSAIGATIVVVGFYMVIWGQIKEKNKISVITRDDLNISNEHEYSDQTTILI